MTSKFSFNLTRDPLRLTEVKFTMNTEVEQTTTHNREYVNTVSTEAYKKPKFIINRIKTYTLVSDKISPKHLTV